MRPIRYNTLWVLVVLAFVALCASINIAIDPYQVFGTQRVAGFNAKKTEASSYAALVKSSQIERVRPRTVLLGTSRVDIGLDPQHGAWSADRQPVYNYALPGSSILSLMQQLQHALSAGPVSTVVVGIEFQDFLRRGAAHASTAPGESERRFLALSQPAGWLRTQQQLVDKAVSSLTMAALTSSMSTLTGQHMAFAGDVSDLGLTSEAPFAGVVKRDGHHDLFLQKDMMLAPGGHKAAIAHRGNSTGAIVELSFLQSLMDFCQANNIELYLFVPPYHAHYLEFVDAVGLWDRFEHWKRALLQVVQDQHQRTGQRVALWDFATYSEHTTEAVPKKGDRGTSMRWFWETMHFKKALGDLLLARMFAGSNADLGVLLTDVDIEAYLLAERLRKAEYRKENVQEVQQLRSLIAASRPARLMH